MTVTLKNLSKSYGALPVLQNVSAVLAGHTVLWGPSGCGKTTLARILWGLEAPDAGEVVFSGGEARKAEESGRAPKAERAEPSGGRGKTADTPARLAGKTKTDKVPAGQADPSKIPAHQTGRLGRLVPHFARRHGLWLAAVFQDERLCGQLTAIENAALVCPAATPQKDIAAEFKKLGMTGAALTTPAALLSGGQRRRVALVRAALAGAPGAVLDEPFRGLDEAARAAAMAYIKEAFADKFLLIATHDAAEAEFFGPQRLVLPLLAERPEGRRDAVP